MEIYEHRILTRVKIHKTTDPCTSQNGENRDRLN